MKKTIKIVFYLQDKEHIYFLDIIKSDMGTLTFSNDILTKIIRDLNDQCFYIQFDENSIKYKIFHNNVLLLEYRLLAFGFRDFNLHHWHIPLMLLEEKLTELIKDNYDLFNTKDSIKDMIENIIIKICRWFDAINR